MRIFMLTPYLPYPLLSGGQVRTYNLLKQISQEHEVTLFALIKDDAERRYIKELEPYCKKVNVFKRTAGPWHPRNLLLAAFTPFPFVVTRNLVMTLKNAIADELKQEKYDLIHVETFYMMPSIPRTELPIILVEQTIEYLGYEDFAEKIQKRLPFLRPLLNWDIKKIRFWEKHYWRTCSRLVTVSEDDRRFMHEVEPSIANIDVVSNGVDMDFFNQTEKKLAKKPTLLFVGTFHWLPNVEAVEFLVEKVWPLIKIAVPDVQLRIVGSSPTAKILDYGKHDSQIEVTGQVKDIRDEYARANVLLAPVFSGKGTRYKVLEAMATQTPVVGTKIALEGIGASPEIHFLLGDSAEEMAQQTISLLQDLRCQQRMGKAGKEFVSQHFSWKRIAKDLLKVYAQTTHSL
jgi:glycosyltransferase involved in cell wall biosynthesis